jgi:hypothetical protein
MDADPNERRRQRKLALALVLGLLVAFSPIVFQFSIGMIPAFLDCGRGADQLHCREPIKQLVVLLPLGSLLVGLLAGLIGGVAAIRNDRSPGRWIVLALLLPLAAMAVSVGIVAVG